jgi:predicted dehydrogenase
MNATPPLSFELPPYRLPYEQMKLDGRVGLIGLHWVMLIMHLPAYASARYDIRAACEIEPERVKEAQAANLPIGDVERNWQDLIRRDDVDVLDCCFGPRGEAADRRRAVVEAAAEAGKPLMIHKPPAIRLGEAVKLAAIAEAAGIPLAVNQNCRYNPANYAVKQLLSPERMGRPRTIELQSYWRGSIWDDGDQPATVGHTTHHVDLLRWWIGQPCVSVYSRSRSNATLSIYEFADGTIAYHHENHSGVERHRVRCHLMCDNGVIKHGHNWNWHIPGAEEDEFVHLWQDLRAGPVKMKLPPHIYEPPWAQHNPYIPHHGPYYDLAGPIAGMMGSLGSLLHAHAIGEPPDNHIRGSIEALRICLAAHLSSRTGKPVNPAALDLDEVAMK